MKTLMNNFHHVILPLFFIGLIGLMAGCQKEDPIPYPLSALPPATQTGENTFGCVINGEPWVAYAPLTPFGGRFVSIYDEKDYGFDNNQQLWLSALRQFPALDLLKDSISSSLLFDIRPINNIGYYNKYNLKEFIIRYSSSKPGPTKIYELDTIAPFHINITKLDTVQKIASGTFEMDLRSTIDSTEVIQIRHGRFDAWYSPG